MTSTSDEPIPSTDELIGAPSPRPSSSHGADDETLRQVPIVPRDLAEQAWREISDMEGGMPPSEIFRAYDIRGLADSELSDANSEQIGRAFGTYLGGSGAVVIGGDVRVSTPRIRAAFARGLNAAGCDAIDVGVVPTPAVYFAMHYYGDKVVGGVAITGSHNPPEYNGFKLCQGTRGLHGDDVQELRRIIEENRFSSGTGSVSEDGDLAEEYMEMLLEKIELRHGLKVVVDAANGAASNFAHYVYKRLGCSVIRMYCDEDGTFPNHPADPTVPEAMVDLRAKVLEEGADLGIGFDGDADRIGIVDDTGRVRAGDEFMALFFREVLKKQPGADAIVEVKCSQALIDDIKAHGGKPLIYKTGHSLIKAKMKELGSLFTGEMSGHMFFADEFYGHDDAIYAGARLMRAIVDSGKKLSELLADLPTYHPTRELRVGCPDTEKFDVVTEVTEALSARFEILDVDGVRVCFPDGWGLVRCSNTSPKLIVRAEGATPARRDEILRLLRDELAKHDQVDIAPLDAELAALAGQ